MFSLEFTRSFKLFLRRFLSFELCFLVFRCSIFKVRFSLRSRGQLIQYITSLSFCQEVFQNFFKFFFLFLASSFAHCLPSFRQLVYYITSPFVCQEVFSNFFKFLFPLSSSSRLSRYRSLKRAYILSLSSLFVNSFLSFFTFFSPTSLFCTLFVSFFRPLLYVCFYSCFLPLFYRFFHIYTYTYATLFDYHILGLPMFLMLFLCILLVFGRKRITFFKVQPFTPSFRNRKSRALLTCASVTMPWLF